LNNIRESTIPNSGSLLITFDAVTEALFTSFFEMSEYCKGNEQSAVFLRLFGRRLQDHQLAMSRAKNSNILGNTHWCLLCEADPDSLATVLSPSIAAAGTSSESRVANAVQANVQPVSRSPLIEVNLCFFLLLLNIF